MSANLSRRELTDTILATIASVTGKPCGDGIAPADAGWQGPPNAVGSNFRVYTVLIPGTATYSEGSFADPSSEWRLPYSIWGFGVRRDQCEAIADRARLALSGMTGDLIHLGDQKYSVLQIQTNTIGATNRYEGTDPPYWGQMDTITVWLSKDNERIG